MHGGLSPRRRARKVKRITRNFLFLFVYVCVFVCVCFMILCFVVFTFSLVLHLVSVGSFANVSEEFTASLGLTLYLAYVRQAVF
jgi:hypothetical protein